MSDEKNDLSAVFAKSGATSHPAARMLIELLSGLLFRAASYHNRAADFGPAGESLDGLKRDLQQAQSQREKDEAFDRFRSPFWDMQASQEEFEEALIMLRGAIPKGGGAAHQRINWEKSIDAVVGFVESLSFNKAAVSVRNIASEFEALAEVGAKLRREYTIVRPYLVGQARQTLNRPMDHRQDEDVCAMVIALQQGMRHWWAIPAWSVVDESMPDPHSPYVGERTELVRGAILYGWEQICPEVAKRKGVPKVSERTARKWIKEKRIKVRRDHGRVWLDSKDLDEIP